MTALVFVDTNVLVYNRDLSDKTKQSRAGQWLSHLWLTRTGRLSFQVLHEYYATVTRRLSHALSPGEARSEIRDFRTWDPIQLDFSVLERAWLIESKFGFSFWNSLIVSAAQLAGCEILLTEDLQDGQDLDGLRIVNPFTHSPDQV